MDDFNYYEGEWNEKMHDSIDFQLNGDDKVYENLYHN